MPVGDVAPEISLVLGAVLSLLFATGAPRRAQGLGALIALASIAVSLSLSLPLSGRPPGHTSFAGTWGLDALTDGARLGILLSTALAALLSPRWFATDPRHGEWYAMLLLSALGAVVLAAAADLATLMVGILLSSATGYTLSSYHRASRMCAEAGAKFYFLGALATPACFFGSVLLYGLAGTTRYAQLGRLLAEGSYPISAGGGVAFLLVGFLFKLGAFPLHPWVPDVSQGSPAPGALFLTLAPKLGALAGLTRLLLVCRVGPSLLPALAALSAATMALGNLAAFWQQDVRRLLGWSSVSQIGYGLMAPIALAGAPLSWGALFSFMLAYTLGHGAAFAVVVSLRGRTRLSDYRGLARQRPWHALSLTAALLSLVGIPPLIGFTAKLALFGAAIEAGYAWLAMWAVLNTVASLFYYLRVIGSMFAGAGRARVSTLGRLPTAVALGTAALTLVAGLASQWVVAAAPNTLFRSARYGRRTRAGSKSAQGSVKPSVKPSVKRSAIETALASGGSSASCRRSSQAMGSATGAFGRARTE